MPCTLLAKDFQFSHYKSYTKGRIEWLLPSDFNDKTPIIKSAFEISESVLNELERNLIYKTSDRMHLIAFKSFNEYDEYRKNQNKLGYYDNPITEDLIEGTVYQCVLLTGNDIDIEYQIRRGIAKQFLNEFLLGFTYRNRFESVKNQKTPQWLIKGFIEHFSGGVSREDFLQFKAKINTSAFRNLNFIEPENEALFGKVLWYFFEKEKGKNLNSVFWMLVKYADNFENLFEYHFGLSFRKWLNARFDELNKNNPTIGNSSDFFIDLKKHESRIAKFNFNNKSESAIVSLSSPFSIEHYLWKISSGTREIIKKTTHEYAHPFPTFKKYSWSYNEETRDWIHVGYHKTWNLQFKNTTIQLAPASQYRIVQSNNDNLTLLKESPGKTELLYYSIQKKCITNEYLLDSNGNKIDEVVLGSDSNLFFITKIRRIKNQYESGIYQLNIRNNTLEEEKIYAIIHGRTEWALKNLIVQSAKKFSFVKNTAMEDAIYNMDLSNPEANTIKTPTKGLSYQQQRILKSDRFIEFFIAKNRWNANIIEFSAPVFARDTFIKTILSFDSISKKNDTIIQRKIYSEAKFTSPFKRKEFSKFLIRKPSNGNKPWQSSGFNPWFYIHRSQFQLWNSDFKLPYDGLVNPIEQYNSPLTFFYSNTIMDVVHKHRLDLNLYSNINRRRIGIQVKHKYRSNNNVNFNSELNYRLRQFSQTNGTSYRNRNTSFKFQIVHPILSSNFSTGIFVLNSQIISLNNSKEKVSLSTSQKNLLQIPIGIITSSNNLNNKTHKTNYQLHSKFITGAILSENSKIPTFSFNGNYHVNGQISIFNWKANLSAIYSFSKQNISYMLGGSEGWISSTANNNFLYNSLREYQLQFLHGGFDIRGLPVGIRIGNSLLHIKTDFGLPLLRLFPNSLKERIFWKSMVVYAFFDGGLAFYGESPGHHSNPYNTKTIKTPNYTLTASTRQNPWVSGIGFGAQVNILNYPIRIEYAEGRIGALKTAPRLLLSLGKNF